MAIVVESYAETAPAFGSSIVINKPTGTASGDLLIAVLNKGTYGRTATGPAGWTEILDTIHPSGFDGPGIALYTLIAGGSEPSSYTFNYSGTQNNVGAIVRISGASGTLRASAASTTNVSDKAPIGPTVTATAGDLLLSAMASNTGSGGLPATVPSGMTLVQDLAAAGTVIGAIASEALASTGATGTRTWATNAGGITARWVVVSIAVAPGASLNNYTLTAAAGSFALTGTAAALKAGRKVAAAAGSYTLTGTAAGLQFGRKVAAGAGTFTLAGVAATFRRTYAVAAGPGSFALAGATAAFVRSYRLTAAAGAYSFTGAAAGLYLGRKVAAGAGSFALAGQAAAFRRGYVVSAASEAFVLTGAVVNLLHGYRLNAWIGAYTLSGQAVGLQWSGEEGGDDGSGWVPGYRRRRLPQLE